MFNSRWNFVTHGCIDGYSRLVVLLHTCTNNLAKTAFELFKESIIEYGIPGKIRVDGGGEFSHHATFMNSIDSETRCIKGKSVHNVRIERHWRDCREKVLDKYIKTFNHMEEHLILDVENEIHMFSLHYVFQPRINQELSQWKQAHNNHPIRTERNQTPTQLWISGIVTNQHQTHSAITNIFNLTIEDRREKIDEFVQSHNWLEPTNIGYVLSRIPSPMSRSELDILSRDINVLEENDNNGIEIYASVVRYIYRCINS